MKTIREYPLPFQENVDLVMHQGAQLLDVVVKPTNWAQEADAYLYAVVDTEAPTEVRRFKVLPAGALMGDGYYIPVGSFALGNVVRFVFEKIIR